MATNYANAKYQEIYDFHTESGKVSILGFHAPEGTLYRQMLNGFFTQFRKFLYKGCSAIMIPAAQLPADPLQISYEAGEPTADPRDMLNPILFHGCHGDNLRAAFNSIYSGTFDDEGVCIGKDENNMTSVPVGEGKNNSWEVLYYRSLSDPTFRKYGVQSGGKLPWLHPMVYNVNTLHQLTPHQNVGKLTKLPGGDTRVFDNSTFGIVNGNNTPELDIINPTFFTGRIGSLGWLDTYDIINGTAGNPAVVPSVLPKIMMGFMMLPPSYKTEMYYRLVITHYFEFKGFNTTLTTPGLWNSYYDWNPISEGYAASTSLETINGTAELATSGVS